MDKSKSNEVYLYKDYVLRREYGDLIIWSQILKESAKRKSSHLIFVTDDEKEDWWWIQSGKTIGPRPELIEEIQEKAGVKMFYMYSPARFLEYAKDFLGIRVKPESINQVNEISQVAAEQRFSTAHLFEKVSLAESGVHNWLLMLYPNKEVTINHVGFPDFIVKDDNEIVGYEVKYIRDPRMWINRWKDIAYRGFYEINKGKMGALQIVFIVDEASKVVDLTNLLRRSEIELPEMVKLVTGIIEKDEHDRPMFKPIRSTHFGGEIR